MIEITNADDRELDLTVDVLLQPTEIDDAGMLFFLFVRRDCLNFVIVVSSISLNSERAAGLIKAVPLGILTPGVKVQKTLHLLNAGSAGGRTLDISIQSRSTATPLDSSQDDSETVLDATETWRTLVVPVVNPIKVVYDVGYRRALGKQLGLADLATYDGEYWDTANGGEAIVCTKLECVGPWNLEIESLKLIRQARRSESSNFQTDNKILQDGEEARIMESSATSQNPDLFAEGMLP